MKRTNWIVTGIGAALMALVAGSFLAQQANAPSLKEEVALRGAIEKETVQGDPKGAIEQYKKLAQSSNHAIAAQALIHMGESYEKLGSNEANKQYALVISKYADQKDAVAQARAHLGETSAKTDGMAAHAVWNAHILDSDFAVSPDGRYISFADSSSNLSVHDLSTGTDRRLTNADSKDAYVEESAFSPDGKQIAYSWYSKKDLNYDLRILSLSGNGTAAPRVLLKSADFQWYGTPAWSPDEKWLAVIAARKGGSGKTHTVLIVSVLDGTFRALGSDYSGQDIYFSPDGKYLAFNRTTAGDSDVFLLDINEGLEIPAVVNPSQDLAMGWSPDGHLLFASDRGGSMGLWALQFRDGKPQGTPKPIISDFGSGGSIGLTASGALYYHVTSGGSSSYLELAPFDLAAGRILSSPVTVGAVHQDQQVINWSPDGKSLAYITPSTARQKPVLKIATESGGTRELVSDEIRYPTGASWSPDSHSLAGFSLAGLGLFQIDVQTGQVSVSKPNTPTDYPAGAPAWSLDQKKLYFRRASNSVGGGDGSVAFIERDLASGTERILIQRPKSTDLGGLNLSPDGRSIATHAGPPNSSALVLIPVTGGEPKELLLRPGLGDISFSPDGRYIALVGGSSRSALLIPVAGGEPRELISATAPLVVSMAMWAPDSGSIFLKKSTAANEQTEIWRVPVDGGQATKLDMNMNLDHIVGGFRVSPSGRQIAFIRGETTPVKHEIWVLENFLSSIPPNK